MERKVGHFSLNLNLLNDDKIMTIKYPDIASEFVICGPLEAYILLTQIQNMS